MPAPRPHPFAAWRKPLVLGLGTALLSAHALAGGLIVVTDSRHPVQTPPHARVIELDGPARIEVELAANLPADPGEAAAVVQRRLKAGGTALQQRIGAAYQGVADAWSLGVTTLPAVVVDRRHVVYGESDVAKAVARIETYRRAQR